jgi:putative nucleotidyltransferase with HDIG domain
MHRLSIIAESVEAVGHIKDQFAGLFDMSLVLRRNITAAPSASYAYLDIDLGDRSGFSDLRYWLNALPKQRTVIFAVDKGARRQAVQACALGATELVTRPVDGKMLLNSLLGDFDSLTQESPRTNKFESVGILAAVDALHRVFASANLGAPLDPAAIDKAGEAVIAQIAADGLVRWINAVRMHHSQTYQHSLLITGIAVGFGRQLGFSSTDRKKLAIAGLIHDVGKARIPVAILEKLGPLDTDEQATMKQHPELGFAALKSVEGMHSEMLDMVLHHHEYLDGSGYPHGLRAGALSDLVRLMTIADIFGALIERRPYKVPMSSEAAYNTLEGMGAKLDADMVREFRPIAQMHS